MASYTAAVDALTDVTAGETLDEAGGGLGHAEVENRQNQVSRDLAAFLDAGGDVYIIHQLDDRSWSSDVPSRAAGDQRVELRGWDDPADVTNGVTTPANLTDLDVWLNLTDYGIAEPWGV